MAGNSSSGVMVVFNLPEVMAVLCIQVDVLVTTAGGIEEDLIKCLAPTYMGDFAMQGIQLRDKGLNRIGNLLVPNDNYCKFEDWVVPILDQLVAEQKSQVHSRGFQISSVAFLCGDFYCCI